MRPPLPEFSLEGNKVLSYYLPNYAYSVFEDFTAIILSYRQRGEEPPAMPVIYEQLGEKYNISPRTIHQHITFVRAERNMSAQRSKEIPEDEQG